jgi:hypothetical protein
VQLIEHTGFGVRTAVMTVEKRGAPVRFVLVPMVHLGTVEFFASVRRVLEGCDTVVTEGVAGRRARVITLAYRISGRLRRDDLVPQGRALDLSSLDGRIVCPDLSAREFAHGWRRVAWHLRALVLVGAPFVGLWMAVVGPRRVIARHRLTVDDEISLEEYEATSAFEGAFEGPRDRALCDELIRLANSGAAQTVGVCWGAVHMRAVTATLLGELGYRIVDADWLTVFPG